ncbi:MAG: prepilin peptidase [Candidatus Saganbacteria bacterium]|nr:prepilin peptidase [Candidatus Saganbacteria bacterium]
MFYLAFLFLIGTVIGSFLNVCIHRIPRGESIVYPSSHCPFCGNKLKAIDLVPLLGFLFLGGKCRYCRKQISWRYPLVEGLTGALFVLCGLHFIASPLWLVFSLGFVSVMLMLFFIDLEHMVVPDTVSVIAIFWGYAFNFIRTFYFLEKGSGFNPFLSALIGMLLAYGTLYSIGVLGQFIFKKEAMGEGDLYIGAVLGACLGWQGALSAIFLAYLLAGVTAIFLLLLRRLKFGDYMPFGPALVSGGLLVFFYGRQLLNWYLNLYF